MKTSSKIVTSSFFLCILLFSNGIWAQHFMQDNSDPVRLLQTPTIAKAYLIPTHGDDAGNQRAVSITGHKPAGDKDTTLQMGVNVSNLSNPVVKVKAPEGYKVKENCAATQSGSDYKTNTIDGDSYQFKGTTVSSCARDTTDTTNRTAVLTLASALADSDDALKLWGLNILFESVPIATPSTNNWLVTCGSASKEGSGGTVFAVGGWPSDLKVPTSNVGTPHATKPSMRPTSLAGDSLVTVGVYFTVSTGLEVNNSLFIKLPSANLSFDIGDGNDDATTSCTQDKIDFKYQLCDATKCESRDVGNMSSTTDSIKCKVNKSGKFIVITIGKTDALLAPISRSVQGAYVTFKVKTANLDKDTALAAGFITTVVLTTQTLFSSFDDYLLIRDWRDYGDLATDVTVKKKSAAAILSPFFFLLTTIICNL